MLHFCPQCGGKLQPGFKFCPSCGDKLPSMEVRGEVQGDGISGPALTQPCNSSRKLRNKEVLFPPAPPITSTPPKPETDHVPHIVTSPRKRRTSPNVKQEGEPKSEPPLPSASSTELWSPSKSKVKAKVRRACAVELLQDGAELHDTTGSKWRIIKILSQNELQLIYKVWQVTPGCKTHESQHILKVGAKDGKIFNEQNFWQRAAKPSSVEKWMKRTKVDFLGIPSCVGFGLHAETYRFLVFPYMGQTLHSIMEDETKPLPEKAVLQLACRILDVLEFIHESEYVHANIHAENIYINFDQDKQVFLAGYCHAFRFCPGGRHVEYREGSRVPHEGAIQFISLESHKGAGPSRRSDLQALGYCMLHWCTGILPWTTMVHNPGMVAIEKQRYMTDVPGLVKSCFGKKKVSSAILVYLSQVISLQYSERPEYQALREGLTVGLQQLGGSLLEPLDLQVK